MGGGKIDAIISESKNRLIFTWGGVRPESHSNPTYNLCLRLRESGCTVIPINQEQFPFKDGIRGLLRRIKWFVNLNFGEAKTIKYMGVTGKSGISCYKKLLVPGLKLFDYIYTPYCDRKATPVCSTDKVRFIIIGQLISRKYVMETIEIFNQLAPTNAVLTVVGSGELETDVAAATSQSSVVSFLGFKSRDEVDRLMADHDYLLLPSLFDGWGCTTNEALLHGCKVIVSDGAGSHSLILNKPYLGTVFRSGDYAGYKRVIESAISDGPLTLQQRESIISWAECLSPQKAAVYLIEQVCYYFGLTNKKPDIPWR